MASRKWLPYNVKLATILLLSLLSFSDCVYYADNGLEQTLAYRFLPAKERREMQQEILNLLGLQHRPKPKSHGTDNSAPKYLQDLYKSLLDEESGDLKVDEKHGPVIIEGEVLSKISLHAINDSDVIMSFVNQFTHRFPHSRHEREKRFWFDISEVQPSQNIMEAELRLFRNLSSSRFDRSHVFNLSIYALVHGDDREDKRLLFVDKKTVGDEHGWIMFNVTEPMINWVVFPSQNLGLYLSITSDSVDGELNAHEIGIVASKGRKDRQPFMLTFLQSPIDYLTSSNRRVTREAKKPRNDVSNADSDAWNPYLNAKDRFSGRSCQKKTLYVSFRDLGWQDWIIAPDGYAAFFCDGECSFPLNAHMNATNHAIVQTLVHLMNPHIVPKPCCAPTKLSAIMVLYFDDNSNVILKKYKNMVVKSCGCH